MSTEQAPSSRPSTSIQYQSTFTLRTFLARNGTQVGILAVFIALWSVFILGAPQTFLSPRIYLAFMTTVPFFGVIALPLTMLIIAGEIDLSFPSIMAIGMVGFLFVYNATGIAFLGIITALVVGILVGALNGAIVVRIGIPSLVATIGTQFFWRGATIVLVDGKGQPLIELRNTFIYNLFVGKTIGNIPNQFWWMLLVGIACWLVLNRSRLGAHLYLIGDNEDSAKLMGINAGRTRMLAFIIVGAAAAFGGLLASFQVLNFFPSLGEGYLLQTLASVFLGGTSVFGGTGTIFGTFLGSYIIGAIQAAIVAMGLTGFWTELIYGLIVILSVAMHALLLKRTN
ncbi:MAG: ABC transporter permease [Caldilineales bacterium]|nr:ABC transporter permease [Caldilineales bacterium]